MVVSAHAVPGHVTPQILQRRCGQKLVDNIKPAGSGVILPTKLWDRLGGIRYVWAKGLSWEKRTPWLENLHSFIETCKLYFLDCFGLHGAVVAKQRYKSNSRARVCALGLSSLIPLVFFSVSLAK